MSSANPFPDLVIPAPSLRGRILNRIVRTVVKQWPRQNPALVVRRSRQFFGLAGRLTPLYSKNVTITPVSQPAGEWLTPVQTADSNRVILYLHGGGYISCSVRSHRPITLPLARISSTRVFSLEYRLAPEHPFPAAVDDAAAGYRWLLQQGHSPEHIVFAGDSAGGGLAIAAMLRLRTQSVPLPAAAVCFAPWVDLTGKCNYRNGQDCSMFRGDDIATFAGLYLRDIAAEHCEASPVFGDLTGLPPLLIQASSAELLFDDALRLHERATAAGVRSRLDVYPGLPHVWQMFIGLIPEAEMALRAAAEFVTKPV
ncbi:MAG TPA: alpha/beta hydrolase [Candidatus Limnocylindrales bacterium]|nr:alpha/beta hydrolase [Candidatus Limnocylindrales bacterium]